MGGEGRRKCAGGCGRWLTDPESLARGYGRVCAERHGITTPAARRLPAGGSGRDAGVVPVIPGQTVLPLRPFQASLDETLLQAP